MERGKREEGVHGIIGVIGGGSGGGGVALAYSLSLPRLLSLSPVSRLFLTADELMMMMMMTDIYLHSG